MGFIGLTRPPKGKVGFFCASFSLIFLERALRLDSLLSLSWQSCALVLFLVGYLDSLGERLPGAGFLGGYSFLMRELGFFAFLSPEST
jgi:hypothetical protein